METELFGVEGGEGRTRKVGALEEAHGGTLYLDEVADMPRETQGKILRVLVDQSFTARRRRRPRCMSTCASSPRPRATSRSESPTGASARTCSIACRWCRSACPALSERREDIPELVDYFHGPDRRRRPACRARVVGDDAMAVLQSHDWPGNIRQLRNNVERLMILAGGDADAEITADMLPPEIGALVPDAPNGQGGEQLMGLPLREAREVFEREYLVAQINRFGGNISRTAEFVGMERSALHRKLKSLGVGA